MKKVLRILCIFVSLLFLTPISAAFAQDILVTLNGKTLQFETPAMMIDNHTYIPLNGYMEALGVQTVVDASNKTITGKKDNTTFTLVLDSVQAKKNNIPVTLEAPPKIVDGKLMVPLRFTAENAGAVVGWNQEGPAVTLTMPTSNIPTLTHSVVTVYTNHTQGSGIILSADGLIATNYHVVHNADLASITFSNGTQYNGEITIVGADVLSDIVILKIDQKDLTPVVFGRPSNELGMGISVTAIGSPNGYQNTVSHGKITSIGNQVISSTAAIDVGSSGGALFDSTGQLIGMTSAFSKKGYYAIPAEKITAVPRNLRLPISQAKNLPIPLVPPKDITTKTEEDRIQVSWEPMAGVDYFRVYLSAEPDSGYKKIDFPSSNSDQWYWDYPYTFQITTTHKGTLYVKVSSVKNELESPLSEPLKIK